jgi:hypothetical protein
MAKISRAQVSRYFSEGDKGSSTKARGHALENLICYLFPTIPGVEIYARNTLNTFETEEIDVAFWNEQLRTGLHFLPYVILTECKNWSQRVGSQEIAYFASRLKNRGCEYGILIATNGIAGSPEMLTAAGFEIAAALIQGQRILVLTRAEIEALTTSQQLVALLKRKICELVVSGTTLA